MRYYVSTDGTIQVNYINCIIDKEYTSYRTREEAVRHAVKVLEKLHEEVTDKFYTMKGLLCNLEKLRASEKAIDEEREKYQEAMDNINALEEEIVRLEKAVGLRRV